MNKFVKQIVRDKAGVWVDARLSSGGTPFEELPSAPGFPQELVYEQEILIPIAGFTEIIYTRDCKTLLNKKPQVITNFYCIPCTTEDEILKAYIYPVF